MSENTTNNHKRKYWQSLEERTSPPVASWETPEFSMSPNEMREEARKKGFSRRNFLKFMGAGAVMMGSACRRPTEQIVPAVIQTPEYIPGESLYYSTSSPDGTGLIVKTREARPIKIAGNPSHPIGMGGATASEIASIMDLYDPDRLRKPALIEKGKKKYTEESSIIGKLTSRLQKGSPYALLTGPINSPSSRALIKDFLSKYPGGQHIEYRQDPTLRQIRDGQAVSYGNAVVPSYHFDKADYILSIDGDFLGTMISPAFFSASFGKNRDLRNNKKKMSRLVVIESMFSTTGSNADERHPIRPGDQVAVVLTIASQIVNKMGQSKYAVGPVKNFLTKFDPDKMPSHIGISKQVIEKIGKELWENRGRSIVVGGSPLAATGKNNSLQIAVNLLNSILDNDGKTINYKNPILLSHGASDKELIEFINGRLKSGAIKTLIVADTNPAFLMPSSLSVKEALTKVEYIVSLNDRIDETGKLSHAVLPSSHFLESWGDVETIQGIHSIRQPVIRPLYNTKSLEDRLIQIAGGTLGGHSSFHKYIKARWSKIKGGESFWNGVLREGYYTPARNAIKANSGGRNFNTASLNSLPDSYERTGDKLGLYYNVQVNDGSLANNAYRQELPEPVTKITWGNFLAMLPETARSRNLKQGSIVNVTLTKPGSKDPKEFISVEMPVHLQPGLHPQSVYIALGYGRTAAGRIADKLGINALDLVTNGTDSLQFSGISVDISESVGRTKLATTQTVYRTNMNKEDKAPFAPAALPNAPYGASSQYDRPIILESSYKDFLENPGKALEKLIEYPKNQDIMTSWKYENMRWHMVVDLSLCTGCGACVTSCNLENNIPMVGADEIKVGREMHWLKIDRYYAGDEASPEVAHQPMLCQHCENAPCENVCPVSATQHNNEGLNVMAYNRCIGTRYCANNCPY
ncbi:MAG: TAT-variant-translocated molybdopterin oxidoreductase, partial [Spirochaetia bacterium]|nr:TAT-variant-translocated molybdopterin oxidoreductase [Spirochaetia bacterium]